MAWQAGDKLHNEEFTIEEVLATKSFSITYLVRNRIGVPFVIKTLNNDLLSSLNQQERIRLENKFYNEALKLQKCHHKHIVQVKQLFSEEEHLCLVMEYVGKYSLADLRPSKLSEEDALRYIQQIGEALIVVHENELIHGNVHPGNILLREGGAESEAVLVDFGLVSDFNYILSRDRTQEISEGFIPPELYVKGEKPYAHSDIYSLAATLYKLLTEQTPVNPVKRRKGEFLVPPQGYDSKISDRINTAILKGMELKPTQRPQSMREWLDLLDSNEDNSDKEKDVTPQPEAKTKIDWVALTAIATLIAAIGTLLSGIVGWIPIFKPSPPPSPIIVPPSPTSSKNP